MGYIGTVLSGFHVYAEDKPCAVVQEKGHAWTWEKHRSARIEYRDGLPVLAR